MSACLFRLSGIILTSALWEMTRSELSALILAQFYDVKKRENCHVGRVFSFLCLVMEVQEGEKDFSSW